jgi:hypothetical protein
VLYLLEIGDDMMFLQENRADVMCLLKIGVHVISILEIEYGIYVH